MNPTQLLHNQGQSLWLDNISRELLDNGTLSRYILELSVSGLTSNPAIFEAAIRTGGAYDAAIRAKTIEGKSGAELFFDLALADLERAADLFAPIHLATGGIDGWVSLEVSPLTADDAAATIAQVAALHARARKRNLFIKIPGTRAGLVAIEASIAAGIPVNVTLLFSCAQYLAAAEAYMRGIERRLAAGLDPALASVASIFVSRWDAAVATEVSETFRNRLGIAVAMQVYAAYRDLLAAPRWQGLAARGARPQRLLWASTGSKDAALSDTYYVEALVAADTINTMPEKTLLAFAAHGKVPAALGHDAGTALATLAEFEREGVDIEALAARLQSEGVAAFAKSWGDLLYRIAGKSSPALPVDLP